MAILSNNEKSPFTDMIRLTYQDMIYNSVALLAGTYKIASIPIHGGLDLAVLARPTLFTNSTAISASVGTNSGTADTLIAAVAIGGTPAAFTPVANTGSAFVQSAGTTTVKAGALPVSLTSTVVPIYLKLTAVPTSTEVTGELLVGFRIVDIGRFLNA
jgi:hypothetical protein